MLTQENKQISNIALICTSPCDYPNIGLFTRKQKRGETLKTIKRTQKANISMNNNNLGYLCRVSLRLRLFGTRPTVHKAWVP